MSISSVSQSEPGVITNMSSERKVRLINFFTFIMIELYVVSPFCRAFCQIRTPFSSHKFIVFQAENTTVNTEGQAKASDEKGKSAINLTK